MTPETMLLQAQVSFEADFITPDSNLGSSFCGLMLDRYMQENSIVLNSHDQPVILSEELMTPEAPAGNAWVVSEDSDISDNLGGGYRIRTCPMHWLIGGPTAMMNLTGFIRDTGITDETCRFRIIYHINGLRDISPMKFLFLFNEPEHIGWWSKFGPFMRKSHREHMAAVLHTNLFWHQEPNKWLQEAHKHLNYGDGYTFDLHRLMDDQLVVNLIQGPHYEHRASLIGNCMRDLGEAIKLTVSDDNEEFHVRAQRFWHEHTEKRHPEAMYRPPRD